MDTSMLKPIFAVAVVSVLAGCAMSARRPPVAVTQPTPVCTNDRQCEAMWAAVPDALEQATWMRVRTQSDFMVDTYVPTGYPRLYGRVTKRPAVAGGYEIVARLRCRHSCPDIENSSLNVFNMLVTNAGFGFEDKSQKK